MPIDTVVTGTTDLDTVMIDLRWQGRFPVWRSANLQNGLIDLAASFKGCNSPKAGRELLMCYPGVPGAAAGQGSTSRCLTAYRTRLAVDLAAIFCITDARCVSIVLTLRLRTLLIALLL